MINLKLSKEQLAILRPILENLPDSEEGQEPQLPVTPVYRTPMGGGDLVSRASPSEKDGRVW